MNFLLIGVCVVSGWLLQRSHLVPKDAHRGVNLWIIYVALPSVAMAYVPSIKWSGELSFAILMPFIVWTGGLVFLRAVSAKLRIDKKTFAALALTAGLGNTSFVGFPLTHAYFGEEGLRVAVVCDQLTFVALSTVGLLTAMSASEMGKPKPTILVKKLFQFPPFLGFVAALILPHIFDVAPAVPLFEKLGGTLIPLALFSVGLQLRLSDWKSDVRLLSVGLGYKLVIAPAIMVCIILTAPVSGVVVRTTVFEAAMAPMITSAILAAEYQLNPRLTTLMVSVGIPLSFATTFLWWLIVSHVL